MSDSIKTSAMLALRYDTQTPLTCDQYY